MRVVHLSYAATGGAGRAAWRQHTALLQAGIDSWWLAINTGLPEIHSVTWKPGPERKKIFSLWPFAAGRVEESRRTMMRAFDEVAPMLACEAVHLPFGDQHLHKHPLVQSADLINLHWVAGMLDYPTFFKATDKPIVWTLHDMHPFLGMFHYEGDEKKNAAVAGKLNQQMLEAKRSYLAQHRGPKAIVTPSHWLMQKAQQNHWLPQAAVKVIPYSIDIDFFRPKDRVECRQALGLSADKKVFLFVSKHIQTPRKGFDLLMNALLQLQPATDWLLVALGADGAGDPKVGSSIIYPGSATDEQLLYWYGAADAVVIPSLEDNLPNTLIEAMACGRPVIALANGGMAEHIREGITGWVAGADDLAALLSTVSSTDDWPAEMAIRQYAESTFHPSRQAAAYTDLYQGLLAS